jgi:hypothetical protein
VRNAVHACTKEVTPMNKDGVKGLRVARRFRYPAGTRVCTDCYDTCPIATGS